MTGCDKCSYNGKVESESTEIDDEPNNSPPDIGFSFAMCHPPYLKKLTRIQPPMEITAVGNNVVRGTVQGILLVVVRGTDDASRTVKLPIVPISELKQNLFLSLVAVKKAVKTIIEQRARLSILETSVFN